MTEQVEQVVKLIRSKGVGVYFITQQPSDIPNPVLAQLGNRVQHALRAYTPLEQKAVRAAAQSFRANPEFSTEEAITDLGTGEALISFLDAKGRPSVVERATVLPPQSAMGAIDEERRSAEIHADELYGKYEESVDNVSAYEIINEVKAIEAEEAAKKAEEEQKAKEKEKAEKEKAKADAKKKASTSKAVNRIGRQIGRTLTRGLLGTLKKWF